MAANAGSIEYDVIADTSGLLKAEKAVDSSTNAMVQDFGKVDKAAKNAGTQITKTSKSVNTAMAGMGRNAGQAGIQVQQLVGQIQGGQNVMQAFAAQSADLGIVLGAPLVGVIASLAFALGGTLAPALFNSNSAMEDLEKTVERLQAVITLSSSGVAEYSDQMKQLAIVSEQLVKTQIGLAIAEQNKAFKQSADVLNDATKEATSFLNVFGSFDEVVGDLTGKKLGEEGFNEAKNALLGFKREVAEFNLKPTTDGADALSESINRLADAGGNATESGRELIQLAIDQVSLFQQGKITLDQLNASLESNSTIISIVGSKTKEFVEALTLEAETLGFTDRALALHTAFLEGATQADYDAINAAFDKIEAHKAETEAIKAKAAAEKKADSEQKSREKSAESFAGGVIKKGMSESERFLADADKLEELRANYLISLELYEMAKTSIEKQEADSRAKTREDELKAELARNNMILASGAQFFDAMAGLFENSEGEQSAAYKAMFALSKGFAIAQAALNLSTAISQASILPFPANIPAMASAASSGASLVSAISGASYGGGRQFGGGVNANSAYRVGEAGPEIFQTQSGKNIMLPGENGKVLSNSDSMDAMGGGDVSVIVENYGAPASATITQDFSEGQRKVIVKMIGQETSRQISENTGPIAKSLKSSTSTTMKANR